MAGIQVMVSVRGANEVVAFLQGVKKRSVDLTPAMKQGGLVMLRSVDKNFKQSGRPVGWKSLSLRYLKRKVAQGFSPFPLIKSGARGLQGSISYEATTRKLVVGTNIIYGRIHQLGGMAGKGHKAHIPARPYLVFQEEDIRRLKALTIAYLNGEEARGA